MRKIVLVIVIMILFFVSSCSNTNNIVENTKPQTIVENKSQKVK